MLSLNNHHPADFGPNIPTASNRSREAPNGYTCSFYKDHLYLYGGYNRRDGQCSNQVQIYSLLDNIWKNPLYLGNNAVRGRYEHTASVYNDMIIFYGGKQDLRDRFCLRTTELLALNPENPDEIRWENSDGIQDGPEECSKHFSHIYNDKMFIFDQMVMGNLSSLDLKTRTWSCNLIVQGEADNIGERVWIFSGSKLFGFYVYPGSQESRYLQMVDLSSPERWQQVILPVDSIPNLLFTNAQTEFNGNIFILGCNSDKTIYQICSYNTRENTWKILENSGDLEERYDQHTLLYKSQILTIRANLLEPPSINIQYAILNEEDLGIENMKAICKDKPESLIKDFKDMFAGMLFTDVVFEVEDQPIPAHKSILAYRSQYFMNLFTEGNQNQQDNKVFKILDIKLHLFKAILQYIYCNEIELDEQLALELLPIIDQYLLENLKGLCEKYLTAQIKKENGISLLIAADNYKLQRLKEACFRFIINNIQNISESDEIMQLSKPLFLELLKFQKNKS